MGNTRKARLPILVSILILTAAAHSVSAQRTATLRRAPITRAVGSPEGTWYVNANNYKVTIVITATAARSFTGTFTVDGGARETLDNISWDTARNLLEFRRKITPYYQWFRLETGDGLLTGRFSHTNQATRPQSAYAWQWRVTGWNAQLGAALAPRVYDININGYLARLRVDKTDRAGAYQGRLKIYARENTPNLRWHENEALEEDITISAWNGSRITFQRGLQQFTGQVSGRKITGSYTEEGVQRAWTGTQAEVLSYGLATRTATERDAWQEMTRRRLRRLLMAGNPPPQGVTLASKQEGISPIPMTVNPPERDDNPLAWPQNYTTTEYQLRFELPNSFGGPAIKRPARALLSLPRTATPGAKLPLVIALNGHGGDAADVMHPENCYFWYGDAWARRGYAVLAIDIPHRPVADRLYFPGAEAIGDELGHPVAEGDYDDPTPFRTIPSIKPGRAELAAAGVPEAADLQFTDWEEDGERAWTVSQTLDWVLANAGAPLDQSRIMITGLSMGGELSTYVAALNPRIGMAISAGFAPNFSLLKYRYSHGCWNWAWADIREYIDGADLFTLIAPRPLIIESGKLDEIYSGYSLLNAAALSGLTGEGDWQSEKTYVQNLRPFATDKEIARRVRAGYGAEAGNFTHYLHYDEHFYHFGDQYADNSVIASSGSCGNNWGAFDAIIRPLHIGVTVPLLIAPQQGPGWQADDGVATDSRTLPDFVDAALGVRRAGGN
ncbi:MAG: alpha/beta hydrolase family protein [Blastocatellia bacterium]